LSEAVAGWTFTQPIWRRGYFVRRVGKAWIGDLQKGLQDTSGRSDLTALSVVLNNLGMVLFKAGMPNEARLLCRAHYRRFAPSPDIREAQLAVQPWINEGRLLASCGNIEGARRRLLLGPRPEAVKVDEWMLSPVDEVVKGVCRNVAVVDGFMLELRASGLEGGDAHLTRMEQRGITGKFVTEYRLQLALACGRTEEAASFLDRLSKPFVYLPTLACYGAAIALVRHDMRKFASSVRMLVALLDGWAKTTDDIASILHALLWLRRIGGATSPAVLGGSSQDYLSRKASEIDDEELQCLLSGRRYNPLAEGSTERDLANILLDDALAVLYRVSRATSRPTWNSTDPYAETGATH
jgi:hypothetical protein